MEHLWPQATQDDYSWNISYDLLSAPTFVASIIGYYFIHGFQREHYSHTMILPLYSILQHYIDSTLIFLYYIE